MTEPNPNPEPQPDPTPEPDPEPQPEPDPTPDPEPDADANEDGTFPRVYVEKLRRESAGYREKAGRADDLAQRLHTALTAATGRLADPTDLEYSEDHLSDAEALIAAVDDLLERKPHLASRKPSGDVGQGASGDTSSVDLAGMLRARA